MRASANPGAAADATISLTVRSIIAGRGLKVIDLSRMTGIPSSTLYRHLADNKWLAGEVALIAAALGKRPGDLYEGKVGRVVVRMEPRAGIEPAAVRLQGHRLIPFGLRRVPGLSRIAA